MSRERWFRGSNEAAAFDWYRSARELDVPLDIARSLYDRAMQRVVDVRHAEALYLRWLREADVARRSVVEPLTPGRVTRVLCELGYGKTWQPRELERLGPGKLTRSLLEASDDAGPPGFADVQRAVGALTAATGQGAVVEAPASPKSSVGRAAAQFASAVNAGVWRASTGAAVAAHAPEALAATSGSRGSPLPDPLRRKFEAALGVDLSSVRIHTDAASAHAADAVAARAYAIDQDIHFGEAYDPSSSADEHLLAHEVVHTVQQRGGPTAPQLQLAVSQSGDALEVEAEAGASALVAGQPFRVGGGAPAAVHRTPRPTTAVNNGMITRDLVVTLRPGGHVTLHTGTYVEVVSRTGSNLHVRVHSGYRGAETDIPADAFRAEPEIADAPSRTTDAPDEHIMYRGFSGPLWGPGGPVLADIDQGAIGDCYLLAALGAIVTANPARIQSMISPHTPNLPSYNVTIYEWGPPDALFHQSGPLQPVTRAIDTNFPVLASAHRATAHLAYAGDEAATHTTAGGATVPVLWPLLIEKAMSYTRGGYENLDNTQHDRRGRSEEGQDTNDAFERLLGTRAEQDHDPDLERDALAMQLPGNPMSARALAAASDPLQLADGALAPRLASYLAAHRAVELTTRATAVTTGPHADQLVDPADRTLAQLYVAHEYVLQRVDTATARIFLYNPHGAAPEHQLSRGLTEDEVRRYFVEINVSGPVADHR